MCNHTTPIILLFSLMPGQAMAWLVEQETSEQEIARGLNALTDANVLPLAILHLQMLTLCNFNKLSDLKLFCSHSHPLAFSATKSNVPPRSSIQAIPVKYQVPVVQRLNNYRIIQQRNAKYKILVTLSNG